MISGPVPPEPFEPEVEVIAAGTRLYRVHSSARGVTEFNPGVGSPTRFAFFGDPPVPVLYGADNAQAAVAESLLHDVPVSGGHIAYGQYADKVLGRVNAVRELRLARLRGLGLRRLGVEARDITDTPATDYPRTVLWAEAAYRAGLDGLSWTSRMCNDTRAVVLFGDRCEGALSQDLEFAVLFQSRAGFEWLVSTCSPLQVEVLPPA